MSDQPVQSEEVAELELDKLTPPWSMLRPVRYDSVEFLEMMDSIRENGILNSILVRPHPHQPGMYEVIDGMWRFESSKQLERRTIPCIIKHGVTDEQVLELQIQAQAVTFETRPVEFAKQMSRLITLREQAGLRTTIKELARQVGKSTQWVSSRLRLLDLCPRAQEAVARGELTLREAAAIAKIKKEHWQLHFLHKSKTLKGRELELAVGQFLAQAHDQTSELRRQLNNEQANKPRLQSMDSLLMELDSLTEVSQIIVQKALTSPLQGAKAMLEWVLNLHEAGREQRATELRHKLSSKERVEIIGRQRYEELKQLRLKRAETLSTYGSKEVTNNE